MGAVRVLSELSHEIPTSADKVLVAVPSPVLMSGLDAAGKLPGTGAGIAAG
jgi:hypothetical protein